jgi:Cu(I)/Ag(I) efflux system membrane protein CusA/SilA
MIHRLIDFSLRNRGLIVVLYLGLAALGYWALLRTPIDAIPDLSDNQVIVFTDWPGRSPQEVEDQVTYPLVTNLQGLPGVRVVRASSAFSFSMINVIFEDNVDLYWARTRVLERLNLVTRQLPEGVIPTLGPDATGVGQIFWYTLESDSMNLRDLRTLQDWYVRYQLNSVPGVAEVASVGGYVQQYQVDVDPNKLRGYGIPLSVVVEAVQRSNNNVGGNVVEQAGQWAVVRGVGLIESTTDVENIVIGAQNGIPIYVRNVADVKLGNAFRIGALDKNGKEAVGGVVIARYGVNTLEVIEAVKEKIAALQGGITSECTDRPVLRSNPAHQPSYINSEASADRGIDTRYAGPHSIPGSLSFNSDRNNSPAIGRVGLLPLHEGDGNQLKSNVSFGHRYSNRSTG